MPVAPNFPQVEPQSSLPVVTPDIVKQTTQDSVQNNQHAPDSSSQANPFEMIFTTSGALNNVDPSVSADGIATQPAPEEDPEKTKLWSDASKEFLKQMKEDALKQRTFTFSVCRQAQRGTLLYHTTDDTSIGDRLSRKALSMILRGTGFRLHHCQVPRMSSQS